MKEGRRIGIRGGDVRKEAKRKWVREIQLLALVMEVGAMSQQMHTAPRS